MVNHFQQAENYDSSPRTDRQVRHEAADLSRLAYSDVRVNITENPSTPCDHLPAVGFEPLTTKEQRQAYVREVAAPLFEGSPPLFAYLDRSSYKGENREFDGRVSIHNMHDFLKTYQTMAETGQNAWPYTEKNAQYVRDLLDFKYPELTGENFAGFSAQALCRRAGMTKMSVKHYDDYAVLATAWKQALNEDVSFSRDVQDSKYTGAADTVTSASPSDRIPCDTPVIQPPAEHAPCDTPALPAKSDLPPAPTEKPCPPVETPCAPVEAPCPPVTQTPADTGADAIKEHDKAVRSRIEDMSTFQNGGSYWKMANKFLHAGMTPCDTDDISNRDINRLTRAFVKLNHSTIDSRGLPNPMVHPGDRVPVPEHLAELAAKHEKLARAIERMMSAE